MHNQMNFVFNHSDKLEALSMQYYELLFKTGVIANRMTENHVQSLKAGEKGAGGYLVPDSMEAQIVQTLAEENVMRRLATVIHMEEHRGTDKRFCVALTSNCASDFLPFPDRLPFDKPCFEKEHLLPAHFAGIA